MPPSATLTHQIPKWTKYVVTELGGRDPLGLSRVSFMLTDYLLQGIITTTSRARYYSFYLWALWHIEKTEAPPRYPEFTAAFRRREAFLALATLRHNPDSGSVVGADAIRPKLAKFRETGEVDTNIAVLPTNVMGGYGQYYSGSLYTLGLTHRTQDGIDQTAWARGGPSQRLRTKCGSDVVPETGTLRGKTDSASRPGEIRPSLLARFSAPGKRRPGA